MARFLLPFILSLLVTLSLNFSKYVSPSPFKLGKEKVSHFQFYWHEILGGTNPTAINIIQSPVLNNSKLLGFGSVNMSDCPITKKPETGSKMLGRAQGFYGVASQEETTMLMALNFVFTTGRYNGSTLTVLGRNPVNQKVREMPVIGGSGLFRFARGYVQLTTYGFNTKLTEAIIRYNVYVLHY